MSIIRFDNPQQQQQRGERTPPGSIIRQRIPDGDPGAKHTLYAMKDVVYKYPCRNEIRGVAQKVCAGLSSDAEKIQAVLRWAVSIMKYEKDPPDTELVKSPCRILREAANNGRATGDCDDYAVLLAACYRELAIPTAFMAVSNQKMTLQNRDVPLDHVFAVAYDRQRKQWVTADPVAPGVSWAGHKFMTEVV
jgi:transglutaminase-like putative cysteine protease